MFMTVYTIIFIPILVFVTVEQIMPGGMSYSYFLVVALLFMVNNIAQRHAIRFLMNERAAKITYIILQVLGLLVNLKAIFQTDIVPWAVYVTSIFPIVFLTWNVRFGLLAAQRQRYINFGENTVLRNTDLQTLMHISLLVLLVKILIIGYCWPI